jgi:hypothetical protein
MPDHSTDPFADYRVRQFLLGGLMSSEQKAFEERLFVDDELERRVRLMETELTDDYAFARLSAADRKRFEQRFLLSKDRKQSLLVSNALRERFAQASCQKKPSIGKWAWPGLDLHRPTVRYAFLSLLLLLVIATAWLVAKEPRLANRFLPKTPPRSSPAPATPQVTHHSSGFESLPNHQEASPSMPLHGASSIDVVLNPNDQGQSIALSLADRALVSVQLVLETSQPGPFQAELLKLDGESVLTADAVKQTETDAKVIFEIPAGLLKAGDYQIKLSRDHDNSRENVASYYFRAQ